MAGGIEEEEEGTFCFFAHINFNFGMEKHMEAKAYKKRTKSV